MPLQNWFNQIEGSFWHQLLVAFKLRVNKNNVSERNKTVILNHLKESADGKKILHNL